MSTILFSGRFDRPHIGHMITIGRLGQQYDKVIIVVLDYPEQKYPIDERVNTLRNALYLMRMRGSYQIVVSKHHFGEIETKQLKEEIPWFDVYGSGNREVLENMKQNIYPTQRVEHIPRYPGYSASEEG
ncbi:MAG: hypothetical protein GY853_14135 [PVC group bacterium]|nr:hypothetical protein [PVC group bacterium]